MSDLGVRRPLTAAKVVGRLKDDGDFHALRRTIVRRVKENVSSSQMSILPNYLHDISRDFEVPDSQSWTVEI
jgi:hypothetical protein